MLRIHESTAEVFESQISNLSQNAIQLWERLFPWILLLQLQPYKYIMLILEMMYLS